MITLTEKRLQELENRIPVYEKMIEGLQSKLLEINEFPKDLAELKSICQVIKERLDLSLLQLFRTQNECNEKTEKLKPQIEKHSKEFDEINTSMANLRSVIEGHTIYITEARNLLKDLSVKHGNSLTLLQQQGESHSRDLDKFNKNLEDSQKRFPRIDNEIGNLKTLDFCRKEEIEKYNHSLKELIRKFESKFAQFDGSIINLQSFQRENENKKPQEPKSYDSEIADIKKDLATVLAVVHPMTSHTPDQEKLDNKVKTMEKSIAQIYELLKKYETR